MIHVSAAEKKLVVKTFFVSTFLDKYKHKTKMTKLPKQK